MQVFYLKATYKIWGKPQTEYYGFFLLRENAETACKLLHRLQYTTVEVVDKGGNGVRLLTWQEWLSGFPGDPRPYWNLAGKTLVDPAREAALIARQDARQQRD
jgi:hypothetical protein